MLIADSEHLRWVVGNNTAIQQEWRCREMRLGRMIYRQQSTRNLESIWVVWSIVNWCSYWGKWWGNNVGVCLGPLMKFCCVGSGWLGTCQRSHRAKSSNAGGKDVGFWRLWNAYFPVFSSGDDEKYRRDGLCGKLRLFCFRLKSSALVIGV